MDLEVVFGVLLILFYIVVVCAVIGAFVLVSGFIATLLGLTGLMWWSVAIVSFIILTGLAGGVTVRKVD